MAKMVLCLGVTMADIENPRSLLIDVDESNQILIPPIVESGTVRELRELAHAEVDKYFDYCDADLKRF